MKKLIVVLAALALCLPVFGRTLLNPGYENEAPGGNYWDADAWENEASNVNQRSTAAVRSGSYGFEIIDPNGSWANSLQRFPGTDISGDTITLTAWTMTPTGTTKQNAWQGGTGILKLEDDDTTAALPGGEAWLPDSTPVGVWTQLTVSTVAEVGRTNFSVVAMANGMGTIYYDDITLTVIPEPAAMIAIVGGILFMLRRK